MIVHNLSDHRKQKAVTIEPKVTVGNLLSILSTLGGISIAFLVAGKVYGSTVERIEEMEKIAPMVHEQAKSQAALMATTEGIRSDIKHLETLHNNLDQKMSRIILLVGSLAGKK